MESGIRAQPLSDEESIIGAANRARAVQQQIDSDLGIGVESNITENTYGLFATAWAVAIDRQGVSNIGSSGRLCLPVRLAQRMRQGEELGALIDQSVGQQNTKQKQGAIGMLTNGLISRTEALETAIIFALARFLNPDYYD